MIIVIWRVWLFLLSYISFRQLPFEPQFPYSDIYLIPSGLPQWIWVWANFDGIHYLGIAKASYFAQYSQVFFPIFPVFIRLVSFLIFDKTLIIGGLLVSLLCFFVSISFFQKLLSLDLRGNQNIKTIKDVILFLLFFPTSFYFGAVYTESLFFLLVVASIYFARMKKWWLAGILGGIASATRITGIVLLPVLLWEYLQAVSSFKNSKAYIDRPFERFKLLIRSPILYIVPLGLVTYMVYLHSVFGDAFYFVHAQSVFGANRLSEGFVFPLQTVWRYMKILFTVQFFSGQFIISLLELMSFICAIVVLIIGHLRKIRFSYLLFGWLMLMIPSITGTFSSLPRYIAIIFPMYMVFGTISPKILRYILLVVFFVLQIFLTLRFTSGLWVS